VLEDVRSFPDAGLLRAEAVDGRIRWSMRTLHRWNLDEEDGRRSARQHAAGFADLFLTACRNWGSHADSRGNLVSLSGGHDSRLVVAGLARSGASVVAVTYRDPSGKREAEVSCARQVTQAIGVEWYCLDLPSPAESAYEELAWLKDGMNWASMAYILSYLQEIVRRWGPDWTYLSGDGGDDCLKVTAPRRSYRQLDDVLEYVLDKETCIPPDRAEAIVKLPPGSLRAELRSVFESYPERDLARRIKHFKIFERGRRCYFEGEDRTRAFLWEDSPFYSLPLFQHCMRVPDRDKYYKTFCREALLAVSPAAARTPVISSGYAPASWKYSFYHRAKELILELPDPFVRLARQLTRSAEASYAVPDAFVAYLQEQLAKDTPLRALLDDKEVFRTLERIGDPHSFFCLWTVVMLEKAYRSRSRQAAPFTRGAR
jgi:asparagine synthase (glutamine-hydrolysing)